MTYGNAPSFGRSLVMVSPLLRTVRLTPGSAAPGLGQPLQPEVRSDVLIEKRSEEDETSGTDQPPGLPHPVKKAVRDRSHEHRDDKGSVSENHRRCEE